MFTVVALLFFPVVLAVSLWRLYQLPRDLLARTRWLNPRHRLAASMASGVIYLALAAYTALLLFTLAKALASPPRTLAEALQTASMVAGYPLVYLAYEWVCYYAILPRSKT
ncbi:MAG: hypothetical protein HY855_16365 [Burkholderiales bacterium]|nr:hypothetical protein [Burkholderiales bacterium]